MKRAVQQMSVLVTLGIVAVVMLSCEHHPTAPKITIPGDTSCTPLGNPRLPFCPPQIGVDPLPPRDTLTTKKP